MMLKYTVRFALALALVGSPLLAVSAEAKKEDPTLMEPAKSILDHYLKISAELAKDSIKGIGEHAAAISKAVKSDDSKMLPADVAKEADVLAQAKDIKAARKAFKPLSASLVTYLADNKAGKGVYHEAYCPMAKANWIQTEKPIKNPYFGKQMLDCGELKN
jgi:Cu(I)/Ag(I) efflux system membrane fusion protein